MVICAPSDGHPGSGPAPSARDAAKSLTQDELARWGTRIRLVASDLDGTLLNAHHALSPRNALAVQRLAQLRADRRAQQPAAAAAAAAEEEDGNERHSQTREAGPVFMIATGKCPSAVIGSVPVPDGTLSVHLNGALLVRLRDTAAPPPPAPASTSAPVSAPASATPAVADADGTEPIHGDVLREHTHLPEDIAVFMDFAEEHQLTLALYCGNTIHSYTGVNAELDVLAPYHEPTPLVHGVSATDDGATVIERQRFIERARDGAIRFHKVLYIGAPERIAALRPALVACAAPRGITVAATIPPCLEVMPAGVSKATALREAAAMLGLDVATECVAFGDSGNDLEMITEAAIGVAVGNALPSLKAVADHVSPHSHDDDAVARVLEVMFDLPAPAMTS